MSRRRQAAAPRAEVLKERKAMQISQTAIAAMQGKKNAIMGDPVFFSAVRKEDIFKIPEPPPGVGPQGKSPKVAMDSAFDGLYSQYATQSIYAEGLCFMGYPYLSQLAQRPEYRRSVNVLVEEMTRKWIKFQCTGDKKAKADKIKKIKAEFTRLKVQERCRQALEHDGIFGKGQIFVDMGDTGQGELSKELVADKVKVTKPIKELTIVEPMWTYPADYNSTNPLAPDYYRPSKWYVMSTEVHDSRLLKFIANPLPDIMRPAYLFGGLSLLQMLKPYVDNWLETRQNVNQVIRSFITYVLKANMQSVLNNGNGAVEAARAEIFNTCKSNQDLLMIDKDTEDFMAVSAPLGSLDKLQAQAQEHICAVTGLPLVKFTGIAPSGLNASGETELIVFYDHIAAEQEKDLRTNIDFIFKLVQLGLFQEIDPEITFDFVPLKEMTEKEQVENEKARADADTAYINAGVLRPKDSRQRLADDETSPYNGIDVEDLPEMPEPEEGEEDVGEEEVPAEDKAMLSEILKGMKVEQERSDVVGGDQEKILQLVMEHLKEDPEYYSKLEKMEVEA